MQSYQFIEHRPLEDPFDIPYLSLETEISEENVPPQKKFPTKLQYNMEVIQEVDSSEANSIGFQTPRHKMDFFKFNSSNRMED